MVIMHYATMTVDLQWLSGCACASLVKTTNASFIWSLKDNVNHNLFSGHVKLNIQIFLWQT